MAVLRIEPEPRVKSARCDTCGGTSRLMHGYIYADEEPHGIYYAEWCEGEHPERRVFLTVSLGDYGREEAIGADRVAFCIETHCDGMRLCDAPAPDFLGRFIPREEALEWPDVSHLWHVADHIAMEDTRMVTARDWLCGDRDRPLDAGY